MEGGTASSGRGGSCARIKAKKGPTPARNIPPTQHASARATLGAASPLASALAHPSACARAVLVSSPSVGVRGWTTMTSSRNRRNWNSGFGFVSDRGCGYGCCESDGSVHGCSRVDWCGLGCSVHSSLGRQTRYRCRDSGRQSLAEARKSGGSARLKCSGGDRSCGSRSLGRRKRGLASAVQVNRRWPVGARLTRGLNSSSRVQSTVPTWMTFNCRFCTILYASASLAANIFMRGICRSSEWRSRAKFGWN